MSSLESKWGLQTEIWKLKKYCNSHGRKWLGSQQEMNNQWIVICESDRGSSDLSLPRQCPTAWKQRSQGSHGERQEEEVLGCWAGLSEETEGAGGLGE